MAWETRKTSPHRYYYRASRNGDGKVVKKYFGRGPLAEAAAAEDKIQQAQQLAIQRAEKARCDGFDRMYFEMRKLTTTTDRILAAAAVGHKPRS